MKTLTVLFPFKISPFVLSPAFSVFHLLESEDSSFHHSSQASKHFFIHLNFKKWREQLEREARGDGDQEAEELLREGGEGVLESRDAGQAPAALLDPPRVLRLGH